ncbi:MAG TPA: sulfatase-like hydrolase/transferase, partial [Chitinophagaceae bacterium]|nr:sulfatase-like hydrolase/transferase [Chitinophagaceae bacterium]
IWYLFFRNINIASIMTVSCLLPFYYTGDLKTWLSDRFPRSFLQSYLFLLSVFGAALLVLFFILRRRRTVPENLFLFLNTAILLFITVDAVTIFLTGSKNKYTLDGKDELSYQACDSCKKPDIYYIIFDAYTSSKQLKDEYGYSNQAIEDYLNNKGFYFAKASKSNYNYTVYSVGSTLNMNYIKNVDTLNKTTDRQYLQALKLSYKNEVASFLQREGYQILNHSLFDFDSYPTTIKNIDFWHIRKLYDNYNLVFKLGRDIGYHFPEKIVSLFDNDRYFVNTPFNRRWLSDAILKEVMTSIKLKTTDPKFVYGHFLEPHRPYFYDSTGKLFDSPQPSYKVAYLHQIAFSNNIIKQITDSIMVYSNRPTVIIFQGDHGISFKEPFHPSHKFPNFNALFFSNRNYRQLSDSITNVNTFRIVLNTFFEQNLTLLPNNYYPVWQ